ncbi:hypothetical protein [Pyruvatibacter sp.]|uniref:hypothetical protein n=1 Tax=Pyruvatibacter sp. TaxID=1981328 RepID=UPI0032EFEF8C
MIRDMHLGLAVAAAFGLAMGVSSFPTAALAEDVYYEEEIVIEETYEETYEEVYEETYEEEVIEEVYEEETIIEETYEEY